MHTTGNLDEVQTQQVTMDTASGMNTPESPASPEGGRSVEETALPRFECPPNFQQVEISTEDESLFLEDIKGTTELWLIRAPQDFDARRLNSKTLSLSGRQILDGTKESDSSYEALASSHSSSDSKSLPHLLVPSKHCADLVPAPTFNGQLSIMESVAVPPVLLPPTPPTRSHELPVGLKQRFLPFGWEQPKRLSVDETDSGPVHTESKKKKKKSHKDKKQKTVADIPQSREESRPHAGQGDTQGGEDRLAGVEEVADDGSTTKAHQKGKKRKQQHSVQNDDTVNQSPVNTEETEPKKKKKKHKK